MTAQTTTLLATLKEICAHLGKSEKTVRKLIRDHGLPAVKEGGEWVSSAESIAAWRINKILKREITGNNGK